MKVVPLHEREHIGLLRLIAESEEERAVLQRFVADGFSIVSQENPDELVITFGQRPCIAKGKPMESASTTVGDIEFSAPVKPTKTSVDPRKWVEP